jgi:hypothetical protein
VPLPHRVQAFHRLLAGRKALADAAMALLLATVLC